MAVKIDFLAGRDGFKKINSTLISVPDNHEFRFMIDLGADKEENLRIIPNVLPYLGKINVIAFTHGHSDHIGGLKYYLSLLQKKFENPIPYLPEIIVHPFTYDVIEYDIPDHLRELFHHIKVHFFEFEKPLDFGPVQVIPIPVSHSIPESASFLVKTPDADILHMGDYRTTEEVFVGHGFDKNVFQKYPFDYLIDDATLSGSDTEALPFSKIQQSIDEVFAESKAFRLIGSLGESDMESLFHFVSVAQKYQRKAVFLVGKKLNNTTKAALKHHLLPDSFKDILFDASVSENMMHSLPKSDQACLIPGKASLSHLLKGKIVPESNTEEAYLDENDAVISLRGGWYGKEKKLQYVWQVLAHKTKHLYPTWMDCKIADLPETKGCFSYTSGHVNKQDKIKFLSSLNKNFYYIPFHGGDQQLRSACAVAESVGIKTLPATGHYQVVIKEKQYKINELSYSYLYLSADGNVSLMTPFNFL